MNTIKTKLVSYYFDTSEPDQKAAYGALKAELKAQGLRCFETWGGSGHYLPFAENGAEVELETKQLFSNQWNTAPISGVSDNGLRVFDWAQDYPINFRKCIKRGHYLEQTAEMQAARDNTVACGYCGKQEPAQKGYTFCPHCLDSEYLTSDLLHLTRMQRISDTTDRAPLTQAEKDHLLPLFKQAQLHGNSERGKLRIERKYADLKAARDRAIHRAETEYHGFKWLMDHNVNTSNVIYYSHTDSFCFGWRKPIDGALYGDLVDVLVEFPFSYEIKRAETA